MKVLTFLEGHGADAAGRTLADVRAMGDDAIEGRHDFIQWLFPLAEPSRAVPGSPVLGAGEIAAIRASDAAREALAANARWYARFLGDNGHWLAPRDHNHLRISRAIRSLRLLHSDALADEFRSVVMDMVDEAGMCAEMAGSIRHWEAA